MRRFEAITNKVCMSCFQCGSAAGSATQACPACVAKQNTHAPLLPSETVARDYAWTALQSIRLFLSDSLRAFFLLLVLVLCLCYYLGVHRYLLAILTPLPKRVERLCIQEALVASEYFRSRKQLPSDHIFNPGGSWEAAMTKLYGREGGFRVMGGLRMGIQGMCLEIRKMCDSPENLDSCRLLVPNPLRRK